MGPKKIRRKKFWIHPACQSKYIALSVLPALILSLFCTFLLLHTGEETLKGITKNITHGVGSISLNIYRLETDKINLPAEEMQSLKENLSSLKASLDENHFEALQSWRRTKLLVLTASLLVICVAAVLALFHSHRVAGPTIRLRSCMESLARGENIPPVRLRAGDQFTDLAEALETLRISLMEERSTPPTSSQE